MSISAEHRRRLAWFEEHKGETLPLAGMTVDGMLLTTKATGIFKPKDLDYSLSIRITLDSPYDDGGVEDLPDGEWSLRYYQENKDPADRDKAYTNRGLMKCIGDRVPVGVIRQVGHIGRQGQYKVLGLATPVDWSAGYFLLESAPHAFPRDVNLLKDIAQAEFDEQSAADIPDNDYDARRRVVQPIVARQGQSEFRAVLIGAYRGHCAVTGCNALPVLEAAHLRPYRGPASNVVNNGLLLRADIHTLLDLQLLAPEPDSRSIVISKQLIGTEYEEFSGKPLADPVALSQRPDDHVLATLWHDFQQAEKDL
jgi:putative restriction endonuclease